MIGAADQVVFVRNVEVPQHAMQKLRAVVRVDEIVIADLYIDRQRGFADALRVRDRSIRGVVRGENIGVARRTDQVRGPSGGLLRAPICESFNPGSSMGFMTATAANCSGCAKAIFNAP